MVGLVPARLDAEASERSALAGRETLVVVQPELRDDLLALTNADRASRGLSALALSDLVSRYATKHSRRMADLGYIFHSGDGQLREALAGSGWAAAGENVGVGTSLEEIESAFMHSGPHRDNVLDRSYDHVAVGVARAHGVVWVTVIFYGS